MKTEKEMEETLLTISNIITNALEKRNTEVKQVIEEWANTTWEHTITPMDCCGEEVINELLKKLGLGEGK